MKKILKKYTKSIIIMCILLIFCDFLWALPPYVVKQVVDIDFSRQDITNTIVFFIVIYISVHLSILIFKYIRDIVINKVICKILKDIRKTVFDKILNFKTITFNKYNSSVLYTRLTVDVDNLFDLFFGLAYRILSSGLYMMFMVIMMYTANINLAIIGSISIIIIAIIVYKTTKVLGRLDNEILKNRDTQNKEYSEIYNKSKLTYLFKLQNKNIEKMDNLLDLELKNRVKYGVIHHFPYWIITMIQAIGIYAIIYYALNIETAITLGSIYLVLYYTKECKEPIEEICNQLEEMQTCINSYKRVKALLNETEEEAIYEGEYIENLKRRYRISKCVHEI